MAEVKRYYWLRLQHDLFASKRIRKLRKKGDKYLVIYLKIQLLSVKTEGVLTFMEEEDSMVEQIAFDIDEDEEDVQETWSFMEKHSLVETDDNIHYLLPYVVSNIGSETASAERGKKYRANMTEEQKEAERERAKLGMRKTRALRTCYERVTNVEKEREIEIEKELEIEKDRIARVCNNTDRGVGEDHLSTTSSSSPSPSLPHMDRPIALSWGTPDMFTDEAIANKYDPYPDITAEVEAEIEEEQRRKEQRKRERELNPPHYTMTKPIKLSWGNPNDFMDESD